jgi:hypothetical protein
MKAVFVIANFIQDFGFFIKFGIFTHDSPIFSADEKPQSADLSPATV